MDSQFDVVSAAIQDSLGQAYDYRSIMHYGSTAFSRNGHNTIEALVDDPQVTSLIGTALDLSDMDVIKVKTINNCLIIQINKLYRCTKREPKKFGGKKNRRKNAIDPNSGLTTPSPSQFTTISETTIEPNKASKRKILSKSESFEKTDSLSSSSLSIEQSKFFILYILIYIIVTNLNTLLSIIFCNPENLSPTKHF